MKNLPSLIRTATKPRAYHSKILFKIYYSSEYPENAEQYSNYFDWLNYIHALWKLAARKKRTTRKQREKMTDKWKLDPNEVSRMMGTANAATLSGRSGRQLTRTSSRNNQIRSYEVILLHQPTQVCVKKKLGPAQMTKNEWGKLVDKTYQELFPLLEKKVAKKLKLPGW